MDVLDNPKYFYLIKKQPFYYKVFKTFFYYYSKFVFTFYTPVEVLGRDNIPNESFIFSSNHNSHLDVALLCVASKKDYNHFAMLAAKDYFFDSWLRRKSINLVMNLIPIDRKVDGVRKFPIDNTLQLCKAFMDFDQRNLIMFPEGTRGEPGIMHPFRLGAAKFAIHLNKPIVPAVIYGSHKVWPRGKILFSWPRKITVFIMKPIYPEQFLTSKNPDEKDIKTAAVEITSFLENKIKEKTKLLYD